MRPPTGWWAPFEGVWYRWKVHAHLPGVIAAVGCVAEAQPPIDVVSEGADGPVLHEHDIVKQSSCDSLGLDFKAKTSGHRMGRPSVGLLTSCHAQTAWRGVLVCPGRVSWAETSDTQICTTLWYKYVFRGLTNP